MLRNILLLSVFVTVILTQDIKFPNTEDPFDGCNFIGRCVNIRRCYTAINNLTALKTCKFEKGEEFVCCPQFSFLDKMSAATIACDDVYPRAYYYLNGITAAANEFPFMAALGWPIEESNDYNYKCGGILISRQYIITAAHCAYINNQAPVVAVLGGINLRAAVNTTFTISEVIVHPDYRPDLAYHDIALVKLRQLAMESDYACLWNWDTLESDNLTGAGYGNTKIGGDPSDDLLMGPLITVPNDECAKFYEKSDFLPDGINSKQICAKDPKEFRDTCQGDSGGPLIMRIRVFDPLRSYVVGITSYGQSCGGKVPAVYTRVSEYVKWIETKVWPGD